MNGFSMLYQCLNNLVPGITSHKLTYVSPHLNCFNSHWHLSWTVYTHLTDNHEQLFYHMSLKKYSIEDKLDYTFKFYLQSLGIKVLVKNLNCYLDNMMKIRTHRFLLVNWPIESVLFSVIDWNWNHYVNQLIMFFRWVYTILMKLLTNITKTS